jgi:heme/copper-type cytochrome/quinol oxidase subunit 3
MEPASIILMGLLLCFLIFILWDRKRLKRSVIAPLSLEKKDKGFAPNAILGWQLAIGLGLISLVLSYIEWRTPALRPYSGRWSWFNEVLFQAFGPHGIAGFHAYAGLVAVGYGIIRWWQTRTRP